MRVALVSGADDKFFSLLSDLLDSLASLGVDSRFSLCVYDFGLRPEQIEALADRGARIVDPGWDVLFPFIADAPSFKKTMIAPPFTPRHFPGFDVYVWIDADVWMQTAEGLDLLVRGADRVGMAACVETDRHYPIVTPGGRPRTVKPAPFVPEIQYGATSWLYSRLRRFYGIEVALRGMFRPLVNAGVYAVRADAPHWAAWSRSLRAAKFTRVGHMCDQLTLNHALISESLRLEILPARCNWICSLRVPALDVDRGLLVEPMLPHEVISIVHLTSFAKNSVAELEMISGGTAVGGLRYRDVRNSAPIARQSDSAPESKRQDAVGAGKEMW